MTLNQQLVYNIMRSTPVGIDAIEDGMSALILIILVLVVLFHNPKPYNNRHYPPRHYDNYPPRHHGNYPPYY